MRKKSTLWRAVCLDTLSLVLAWHTVDALTLSLTFQGCGGGGWGGVGAEGGHKGPLVLSCVDVVWGNLVQWDNF